MIRTLLLQRILPFGDLRLAIQPVKDKPNDLAEVHLLTGVNGTGKTRLLSILAALLGNEDALKKRMKGIPPHRWIYASGGSPTGAPPSGWESYFASENSCGWQQTAQLHQWMQSVPAFAYNGTAYLSDSGITVMAAVGKPNRKDCLSFARESKSSGPILQSITNIKVQAAVDSLTPGQEHVKSRALRIIQTLEKAITTITGQRFHFSVVTYPTPTLRVTWGESDLPFDVLPDGLRSIIGWIAHAVVMMDAWLQGQGDLMGTEAVFLLDEIESHLHPIWQRKVLPAFQTLFPRSQIFVATHSPFVIASLNHGRIYRLRSGDKGNVEVDASDASPGDSYITVLEDIMGLKEWYDPETEGLLNDFRSERERAYGGDQSAKAKAVQLAQQIGKRSLELDYMMGKELAQMERQLACK